MTDPRDARTPLTRWTGLATIALLALVASLAVTRTWYTVERPLPAAVHDGGEVFRTLPPKDAPAGGGLGSGHASAAVVLEDGQPLRATPSLYGEDAPRGSFSYGEHSIRITSTDGSDPTENGRSYTLAYKAPWMGAALRRALLALLGVGFVHVWLDRRLRRTLARRLPAWGRLAYAVAIVGIVAAAIAQRVSIDAPPFADGDTWGYLAPVISWFEGEGFRHTYGRHFIYPAFLISWIRVSGTYASIVFAQHLLGILSGLVLLAAWHRIPRMVSLGVGQTLIHRVLGVGLLASAVHYMWQVRVEHMIRPEAVYSFGATVLVFLAMRLIELAPSHRPAGVAWAGAAVVLASLVLSALRPQSALQVPVCLVLVVACCCWARLPWPSQLRVVGMPVLLYGIAIWWPERTLGRSDPYVGRMLPGVLLSSHMPTIAETMRMDVEDPATSADERRFLMGLLESWDRVRRDFEASGAITFPRLGYDPQRVFYDGIYDSVREHAGSPEASRQWCLSYFLRTIAREPSAFVSKVWTQLQTFLGPAPHSHVYQRYGMIEVDVLRKRSLEALGAHIERQPSRHAPTLDYMNTLAKVEPARIEHATWSLSWLLPYQAWFVELAGLYRLLIVLGAAATVVLLLLPSKDAEARRGRHQFALAAAFLFAALMAVHLTSAAVFTLEIHRYIYSQHVLILFTQVVLMFAVLHALGAIVDIVLERCRPAWQLERDAGDSEPLEMRPREGGALHS